MSDKEVRAALQSVEVRAADGGGVKVSGYAAVFNERADIGGYFEEQFAPGAFDGVLQDDVVFLINHRGLPLARTRSGTLALRVDDRGLFMATELNAEDADAKRVITKMERGDLDKMSVAFSVEAQEWDESGEVPLRTIKKIGRLFDVSVVTEPAYSGTDIGLRSLEAARDGLNQNSREVRQRRMRMQLALQGGESPKTRAGQERR